MRVHILRRAGTFTRRVETHHPLVKIPALHRAEGASSTRRAPQISGREGGWRKPRVSREKSGTSIAATAAGVITCIFANDAAFGKQMAAQGWQVLSVGTDTSWLAMIAQQMLP